MGWESPYGGTGLVKGVSNLTLQIDSLQKWSARPICFVNLNASQCTKELNVTVYKMPDDVNIGLWLSDTVEEGENFAVECEVIEIAPIHRVSIKLLNGNKILGEMWGNGSTSFSPVSRIFYFLQNGTREYNGVRLHCEVKIDLGPVQDLPATSSKPFQLIVHYPPTFSQAENETLTLSDGDQMSLNCSASGEPAPQYSWNIPHMSKVPNGTQDIFNSSFKYAGTYECTAANSRGAVTKYFTVTQAPRVRTTLAVVLGVFLAVAVVLAILGIFFLTPQGTFSCSKLGFTPVSGPV
ncbi:vascular cell adhesion protein 1-like isoform 2-T2 [Syngnathus typhle]